MLRGTGVGMLFADLQKEEKERRTRFDELKTTERISELKIDTEARSLYMCFVEQDRKIRDYHHQNLEYIKLLQEAQKAQKQLDEQQQQEVVKPKPVPKELQNVPSKVASLMKRVRLVFALLRTFPLQQTICSHQRHRQQMASSL